MIIFLYGSDSYRLKENIDTIVGTYRKKHKNGINYYRFDFENGGDFDLLENAFKTVSFFDEAKLIVIKNFFSAKPTLSNKLISLVNNFKITADKKNVLVCVENKEAKELQKADKELFNFLTVKPNLVRDIAFLTGAKLRSWVTNKFKENGHNISSIAAERLISVVGNDSWALANEIEKLCNYADQAGIKTGLTGKDVDLLVSRKEDDSIFDLVDAVGNQNKAKAFEMLYRLINSGRDPHYLLSMLVYHFENLLSVSDMLSRKPDFWKSGYCQKVRTPSFCRRKSYQPSAQVLQRRSAFQVQPSRRTGHLFKRRTDQFGGRAL